MCTHSLDYGIVVNPLNYDVICTPYDVICTPHDLISTPSSLIKEMLFLPLTYVLPPKNILPQTNAFSQKKTIITHETNVFFFHQTNLLHPK